MLRINEVRASIHGEQPFIGAPCVIVRLQGCNLRCPYCDTKGSIAEIGGMQQSIFEIKEFIDQIGYRDVLITGGEPLLQEEVHTLIDELLLHRITIETNGTVRIPINRRPNCFYVMDYKMIKLTKEQKKMTGENILELGHQGGAVKFVFTEYFAPEEANHIRATLDLAKQFHKLIIIFSFSSAEIAQTWMPYLLEYSRNAIAEIRFQLQLHKILGVA